ncbi:MAG: thioredoxin domain-containing protein [SAR324 cluster bacterium]|nr:thioredoxin domain-containing protein [SAR324 cluster bacterium]
MKIKKSLYITKLSLLSLLALLAVINFNSQNIFAQGSLAGRYELAPNVGTAPAARSFDKIKVVELFSVSCGHCYNFFKEEDKFKKAFNGKVSFVSFDMGWMGDNLARFFQLAVQEKKEKKAKEILFSAFFNAGMHNLNDPKVLQVFAGELKITGDLDKKMRTKFITKKMVDLQKLVSRNKINSTPTFIINDVIIVKGANIANLAKVINSLLKEPVSF